MQVGYLAREEDVFGKASRVEGIMPAIMKFARERGLCPEQPCKVAVMHGSQTIDSTGNPIVKILDA